MLRGCLLRLILFLLLMFIRVLIQAAWYIILVYFYSILVLFIGLKKTVENLTENVVWKAATEWRMDFRLQEYLRKVTPVVAYVCIITCWFFTAVTTTYLLVFLLKPMVWR